MSIVPLVLAVVIAQAGPNASVPDAGGKDKAKALLKQGSSLFEQGDYSAALERFEAAYAAFPSPKLKFNIGQADRALGRPVDALLAFEEFLSGTPDGSAEAKEDAQRAVAELRSSLGKVKVDCSASAAEIFLDGRRVGTSPLAAPIWATPGRHQVSVRHAAYSPAVEDVDVLAGTQKVVSIQLRRSVPPPRLSLAKDEPRAPAITTVPDSDVRRTPSNGLRITRRSWFAIGATGVLLAGATIAGLMANARQTELEGTCGRTVARCTETEIDTVKIRARTSNVLWVLGGAAAVTSGVVLYLDSRDRAVSIAWRF